MATQKRRSLEIHGHPVEVECSISSIDAHIGSMLSPASFLQPPNGFAPCTGSVHPFNSDVVRYVSSRARLVVQTSELSDIYEDEERFWIVDERWGVCEINFLKSQWRSWVVPSPWVNDFHCFELAVLWPMAQLLRGRGLHLLPAVSAARGAWGALFISPFGLEPEVGALIRAGYRIVGQRWTAIRAEENRALLLHLPGKMERPGVSHDRMHDNTRWIDATAGYSSSSQGDASCQAVFIASHVRRPRARLQEIGPKSGAAILSRRWPIAQLRPPQRISEIPRFLAGTARCCEVQLSDNGKDLVGLIEAFRATQRAVYAA